MTGTLGAGGVLGMHKIILQILCEAAAPILYVCISESTAVIPAGTIMTAAEVLHVEGVG